MKRLAAGQMALVALVAFILALSASLPASSWGAVKVIQAGRDKALIDSNIINDSINFDNSMLWQTPDLQYTRLLASSGGNSMPWPIPVHRNMMRVRPAAPVSAVPEANIYVLLLVGLGLLALSIRREDENKFDH